MWTPSGAFDEQRAQFGDRGGRRSLPLSLTESERDIREGEFPVTGAPLSQVYADLLDQQIERLLAMHDADGAFQAPGSGYSIYEQNMMYPLALSYLREGG